METQAGKQKPVVKHFLDQEEEKRKRKLAENPQQNQGLEVEDILAHGDGSNVTDEEAQEILEYISMQEGWNANFTDEGRVKNVQYHGDGVGVEDFPLTLDNDIGSIEAEAGGEVADNPLDAIASVEYGKPARDKAIMKYNEHNKDDIGAHEMPAPIEVMVSDVNGEFNIEDTVERDMRVENLIQDLIRYEALEEKHGGRMKQIAASGSIQPNHGVKAEEGEVDDFVYERMNGGENPSMIAVQAPDFAHFNASGRFQRGENGYNQIFSRFREVLYDLAFSDSDQTFRVQDAEEKWDIEGFENAVLPEHGSQGYVRALEQVENVRDLLEYQMDVPTVMLTPDVSEVVDANGEDLSEDFSDAVPMVVGDDEGVEARISYRDIVENMFVTGYVPQEDEEGNLNLRKVKWDLSDHELDEAMESLSNQMNEHHITFSWEDLNIMDNREEKRYVGNSPYWKQVMLGSAAQNEESEKTQKLYKRHGLGDDDAAYKVRENVDQHGIDAQLPDGTKVSDLSSEIRENHSEGVKKAYNPEQASIVYSALMAEDMDYNDFDDLDELVDWAVEKIYLDGNSYERVQNPEGQEEFWNWIADQGYNQVIQSLQEQHGSVSREFGALLNNGGPEALLERTNRTSGTYNET